MTLSSSVLWCSSSPEQLLTLCLEPVVLSFEVHLLSSSEAPSCSLFSRFSRPPLSLVLVRDRPEGSSQLFSLNSSHQKVQEDYRLSGLDLR